MSTTGHCQQCGRGIISGDLCEQCVIDVYMIDQDEDCGQCDGSGYWYHCIDGFCLNAEEGCDLCARRCDFCNAPRLTKKQMDENIALGQILADALKKTKPEDGGI